MRSPSKRPFTFTIVKNTAPGGRLCKVCEYNEAAGAVVEHTDASMYQGIGRRVRCASIGEFMEIRARLGEHNALMMGQPMHENVEIVTQDKLPGIPPEVRREKHYIARDRAHMSWPDGPAIVMLDLDRPDQFPGEIQERAPTTPENWRQLLIDLIPPLNNVQMAWAVSSSSCIFNGTAELHGIRGQRFYFVIESGQDIPRFKDALHDALVLRDLAWYSVSTSGRTLKRFPFDLAVYTPEHLDFAAGPHCKAPLEWRPPDPEIWNDGGEYLRSSDIPAGGDAEKRRVADILAAKRTAKLGEARAIRDRWVQETGQRIVNRGTTDPANAQTIANVALDRGVLLPEFLLTDSNGDTLAVGELLADPAKNHGRRFHDPIEPEYGGDSRIAVFLVDADGDARIYSHAHGGQTWQCRRSLPTIRLGQTHDTVDQITQALEQDRCGLYRNGNSLVCVNEVDGLIHPLDPDGLRLKLQRRFEVVGISRGSNLIPRDIPHWVLTGLIVEAHELPLRRLNAVVRGPYAHADGTPVDAPGYDPVSEVFYLSPSPYPPTVRRELNTGDAEAALRRLWYVVSQFPLPTDVDRGVLLSALLTAVVRASLPIAPAYLFASHTAGTGKTLLAGTVGALHTGTAVAGSSLPGNEEEIRKHLFAALRHGETFLLYDNVERGSRLDSAVLAQNVTSPDVQERVLGVSNVERRPNRMMLALTGNNVILHGDLNRRILTVNLDAGLEHPWEREFDFQPVRHVLANWLELRIAALELIQAWRTAGSPRAKGASGFPEWDALVRSVVVWVAGNLNVGFGFADPLATLRTAYGEDPESESLGNLLVAWEGLFGNREIQLREVQDVVDRVFSAEGSEGSPEAEVPFVEAHRLVLGTEKSRTTNGQTRFGMYLARHAGRIVGGLRLEKGGTSGGARRWRVVGTKSSSETGDTSSRNSVSGDDR